MLQALELLLTELAGGHVQTGTTPSHWSLLGVENLEQRNSPQLLVEASIEMDASQDSLDARWSRLGVGDDFCALVSAPNFGLINQPATWTRRQVLEAGK